MSLVVDRVECLASSLTYKMQKKDHWRRWGGDVGSKLPPSQGGSLPVEKESFSLWEEREKRVPYCGGRGKK